MIHLENMEIFSQAHQMYAKGIEDDKPSEAEIQQAVCNQQKHAKHPVDFMQSRGFLL